MHIYVCHVWHKLNNTPGLVISSWFQRKELLCLLHSPPPPPHPPFYCTLLQKNDLSIFTSFCIIWHFAIESWFCFYKFWSRSWEHVLINSSRVWFVSHGAGKNIFWSLIMMIWGILLQNVHFMMVIPITAIRWANIGILLAVLLVNVD